jgi:Bacteriocin-protection, YdeI or OmpD-Associated/Domain of unknown function (DUF1905)
MSPVEFEATVVQDGQGFFIEVPDDVVAALGKGKRPAVLVTLNGYGYPWTIAVYGGKSYLGLRREVREAAGVVPGQTLVVTLTLDDQPRTVEVPSDLVGVLERDPDAKSAFERLSYTNQKELVAWVEGAKRPETRERRLSEVRKKLLG